MINDLGLISEVQSITEVVPEEYGRLSTRNSPRSTRGRSSAEEAWAFKGRGSELYLPGAGRNSLIML